MKTLFATLAAAAALSIGTVGHAEVLNFNDPSAPIEFDAGGATYTESGFTLSGPGVPFLVIDEMLIGGLTDDNGVPIASSLMAVGGGAFSLVSMDYAFFDLSFGADPVPGVLSVAGLLNGVQVASQTFTLGSAASVSFGSAFGNLTSVTFSGTSAFGLDNLNVTAVAAPVPEPATLALTAIGLLGVVLRVNRRHQRGRLSAG